MRLFQTESSKYNSSIAIDASTVGETTVTIAVHATRNEEVCILNNILQNSDYIESDIMLGSGKEKTRVGGFSVFSTKASDLDNDTDEVFFKKVIKEHNNLIVGFYHRHDKHTNTEDIEAVHSAILIHDIININEESPLILLDGDKNKGKNLVRAFSKLSDKNLPIVNCFQAEYYYPHALLADITANYFARKIDKESFNHSNSLINIYSAKYKEQNKWGKSFHSLKNSDEKYTIEPITQRRADSRAERIRCWYDGIVTSDKRLKSVKTDSINPISQYLKNNGYDELASEFEDI